MKTATELSREVDFLKTKIQKIEQGLKDLTSVKVSIVHANSGDVLEDGSVIVAKSIAVTHSGGMALVAAPASVEVECQWSKKFSDVFESLSANGFTPSQWFIPSLGQLRMAYFRREVREHFSVQALYWSSDEETHDLAQSLDFRMNTKCTSFKNSFRRVRPFRTLTY
jgi:ribosomal silencing factor RsfS